MKLCLVTLASWNFLKADQNETLARHPGSKHSVHRAELEVR